MALCLTQDLRSSTISYAISKDWTRMSSPAAIEPGWLVDAFASYLNNLFEIV